VMTSCGNPIVIAIVSLVIGVAIAFEIDRASGLDHKPNTIRPTIRSVVYTGSRWNVIQIGDVLGATNGIE